MDAQENYRLVNKFRTIVMLAVQGPHTKQTAKEILLLLHGVDLHIGKRNIKDSLDFVIKSLETNTNLIPEIPPFIKMLLEEYRIGLKKGEF